MVVRTCPTRRRYQLQKASRVRRKWFPVFVVVIPIAFWFGYKEIKTHLEPPKAVLVLGGSHEREKFAAQFALENPDLPIWVSGGSSEWYVRKVFAKAGIESSRLNLDYQAVDTVTNFTTLVDELKARGIDSIYLITSDYHMRRASVIGEIVLGSRGIVFKSVSVPSEKPPEPVEKSVRDGARAILWVATGRTGSTLSRFFDN